VSRGVDAAVLLLAVLALLSMPLPLPPSSPFFFGSSSLLSLALPPPPPEAHDRCFW
jgi:hypothetical protein